MSETTGGKKNMWFGKGDERRKAGNLRKRTRNMGLKKEKISINSCGDINEKLRRTDPREERKTRTGIKRQAIDRYFFLL